MFSNGGYVMIDCTGLDLTKSTAQSITGLYNKVKTAMQSGKMIYAVNANWGGKNITPISVFAIQTSDDTITCTASTLQVIVTNADSVTINNMIAGSSKNGR